MPLSDQVGADSTALIVQRAPCAGRTSNLTRHFIRDNVLGTIHMATGFRMLGGVNKKRAWLIVIMSHALYPIIPIRTRLVVV